ncbi:hypothetical protein STEG23_008525, partial [Scotinomys teguina]
ICSSNGQEISELSPIDSSIQGKDAGSENQFGFLICKMSQLERRTSSSITI